MRTLLLVAAGVVVVTLAGFGAERWWPLEWAAALRLHLAALALALGAVAAAARAWRTAVLAAIGVLLNAAVVAPLWVGPRAEAGAGAVDGEPALEVVFFNAKIDADRDAVAAELANDRPDVAVLAAVTSGWADDLAPTGMDVALSRPPGTSLELLVLVAPEVEVVRAEIGGPGDGRDALTAVTVDAGFGPVRVLGLHPVSPAGAERVRRRNRLLERAASRAVEGGAPAVMVGDLNTVPWSPRFRAVLADGGLVDSQSGRGPQPSWPAALGPFGVPLDHVLHTPDLVTLERSVGGSFGSDHRLVRARLTPVD
jgi:endonuclease/exonuclease/phosphatase (EEP) superfamily protein YafD